MGPGAWNRRGLEELTHGLLGGAALGQGSVHCHLVHTVAETLCPDQALLTSVVFFQFWPFFSLYFYNVLYSTCIIFLCSSLYFCFSEKFSY